ncbi:MAG: ABC transporter permease subunit, partial [Christensenellales bacterium]
GANKLKILVHIDFPSLLPTIVMLGILAIGGILGVAFEKIYLMQTGLNLGVSEVISTYVYKIGVVGQDYGFGAAVGLFNSLIGFVLLCLANVLCRKFTDYSLW